MKKQVYFVLGAAVWLAGCGTPGAPRPPSLHLPRPVGDLAATRVGSTVTLTWTEPQNTTDGENVRALGPTLVCMGVNDFPMTHCDQALADLSQAQYASCAPKIGQPVTCAVALPEQVQQQNPLGQATFAVEVLNANGKSAGLSNQVRVPTAPTLAAPTGIAATIQPEQILITATMPTWLNAIAATGLNARQFRFDLYREEPGGAARMDLRDCSEIVSGAAEISCRDTNFEWEHTYVYRIASVTSVSIDHKEVEIEGTPSQPVEVVARDTFPPAAPTGLQAVASGVGQAAFVDLSWAPNTESDLAGYNVYRNEPGQAPVKINGELVKAPAYRDKDVQRGHTYFYAVSAVDLRGNESRKSAEASETVQ
jgi:hypothetical protein